MSSTATDINKVSRRRAFSKTDRTTLSAFVGIPLFFHLLLVWIPALLTILLSIHILVWYFNQPHQVGRTCKL